MACDNMVTQYVPKGWDCKEVESRCGSTGINGEQLLCDECVEDANFLIFLMRSLEEYPQGWKDVPGDVCRHGNYIGDAGGPDYICGECEYGD